jgi:membrane protein YdbS with pleckstrin-like domain
VRGPASGGDRASRSPQGQSFPPSILWFAHLTATGFARASLVGETDESGAKVASVSGADAIARIPLGDELTMETIHTEQISTDTLVASDVPGPETPAATIVAAKPPSANEGLGTDGEFDVWEGGYALRGFSIDALLLGLLSIGWLTLAMNAWGPKGDFWTPITFISGIVLGIAWLLFMRRVASARFGHHYRLTDRRLFISTGFLSRRRDQIELLRVQDVYTRQSFSQRWLSVGTVIIVSSEPHLPFAHLVGVAEPKSIMDLIWHHARMERDKRSVKVDEI